MATRRPPRPAATIRRATAWNVRKVPFRFTASVRSQSSAVRSRNGCVAMIPALATACVIVPNVVSSAATVSWTDATLVTSSRCAEAVPPDIAISETIRSAPARSRSATATRAPSTARHRATAAPIPPAAPVTRTMAPSNRRRLMPGSPLLAGSAGSRRSRRIDRAPRRSRAFRGCPGRSSRARHRSRSPPKASAPGR